MVNSKRNENKRTFNESAYDEHVPCVFVAVGL